MAGTTKDSVTLKEVMIGSGYSIPEGKGNLSFNALIEGTGPTTETCEDPEATPAAGAVASGTTVTLTAGTEGSTILYTTDGSEPGYGASVYSAPIEITAATTIKAVAVKSGCYNSETIEAAYTIAE